ncbi:MAG: dihydrolipoyl dehydrogenase [Anditalea sp.]
MTKKDQKDVVIIGAGPGGYAAAFRAADLGLKVTLIDPEANPGGSCLYYGCVPVKALLELLEMKEEAAKAEEWGLNFGDPEIDTKTLVEWKNKVVNELTEGIGLLSKERKIEYIQGKASFVSDKELEIKTNKGELSTLKFKKAIIATGSIPKELPDFPFDHKRVIDSTDALELKEVPPNMLVIGGGYIGPELGSVYNSLGSKVSLVEKTSRFLSWVDPDLVEVFEKENKGLFEELFFETSVEKVSIEKEKVKVALKNKDREWENEYDLVLVAIGREPHTRYLNLDKTGMETDEKGFIKVDEKLKTSRENIYAIGDVTQRPLFANKATHEGRNVAEAIAGKNGADYNPKAIPSIVATTRTEIAWCGLMETEAKDEGVDIKVVKFPWSASGRASSMGLSNGLTKLILEAASGKVLGGGVVGKNAGSLISEITMAIEMAATAKDMALTIHPHPTLSETIMEAAELFIGSTTHLPGR